MIFIIYPKKISIDKHKRKKRNHNEIEEKNEPKFIQKKRFKYAENAKLNDFVKNKFNVKDKYLKIDKDIEYFISVPNEELLKNMEKEYFNNYIYLYNIKNKIDINIPDIIEIETNHDGNCYYNCLSYYFTGTQDYNFFFRYLLYKYCSDFKKEIKNEFPTVPYFDLDYETEDYINKIKESSFWAGDLEISQSIYLYNINIDVYIKNNSNNILN